MNKRFVIHSLLTLAVASSLLTLQAELTRYGTRPGTKVLIDGTSTIHDWTVEGKVIAGVMDLDSKIKIGEDCPDAKAGKVDAAVKVSIPITSLKSGKDLMDNIMYDAMKKDEHPKIAYELKELLLKAPPKAGAAVEFDSKGDLTVSGVKKEISMPVKMEKTPEGLFKITGVVTVKMTDYGITPPAPKVAAGLIKTGDEVKLTIEWLTKMATP